MKFLTLDDPDFVTLSGTPHPAGCSRGMHAGSPHGMKSVATMCVALLVGVKGVSRHHRCCCRDAKRAVPIVVARARLAGASLTRQCTEI